MQKVLIVLIAVLMLLTTAGAEALPKGIIDPPANFDARQEGVNYGEMILETYPSHTTGNTRKVMVLLPPEYDEEKTYPVLYLLHGSGGDHSEWSRGKPDTVLGNLIAAGDAREMIIVMPNVRARWNDSTDAEDLYSAEANAAFDNFINDLRDDLMPFLKETYPIAEGRENTAIAGLSMGGRVALYIGLAMPETFGYVGAFSPASGVVSSSAKKGLFETAEFRAAEGLDTYILINTGRYDDRVGEWPETYFNTLTANGTESVFYLAPGGHDFTVWKHGLYNFVRNIFN